jgi:branched-chain amino acid transport system permease protein
MLSPVVIGALIQTGVIVILCVGFTFTYMVEKFPNFAHTAIATFGTVLSYSLVRIYGFNPYTTIPLSMLLCGLISLLLYVAVIRPIKATGAREITLTFALFALAQVMASIVNIYSYWYMLNQGHPTSGFSLVSWDFKWQGYPGILLVIIPVCAVLVAALWFFLTKVKQGIAFRAVAEDEVLASSLGVNTNIVHILTWLITGALAGLAGAMIPLWRYTGLGYNDEFLLLVMAGSVMGGINSVAGALIGGFLAATSQKVLGALAIAAFGVEAVAYESLYPTLLIATILMLEPEGIMGFFDHPHNPAETLKTYANRLRRILAKATHAT